MQLFKANNWKDVLLHLTVAFGLGIILILVFFYVYLPFTTDHGETITVPDVRGVAYEELDEFLIKRNLRYEITEDSSYSPEFPPLTVLKQFPLPNSKVKENRKIYLTLNSESPPLVKMPELKDASLKMAQMVINSFDLKLGEVEYAPDLALNAVLEIKYKGNTIKPGERIPKGSVIDLVVGDGFGNQTLEAPNLIGQDAESARIAIIGSGLKVGEITYELTGMAVKERRVNEDSVIYYREQVDPGAVFRQDPKPGTSIRLQEVIDLWIYQPDSINLNPSLLDQ